MLIYDIEMFPNFFFVGFYDIDTKVVSKFEISERKDEGKALMDFLVNHKNDTFIGFNNIAYDYPMLHFFILTLGKNRNIPTIALVNKLYHKSLEIGSKMRKGFGAKITKPILRQIDLFLINHFNNKSKMVSLKELEFNMNMDNIQELPYPFNEHLTSEQMDNVIEYWYNDIEATKRLYERCTDMIEFRERMSLIYELDFTNYNDVKIGEAILIDALSKKLGWSRDDIKSMRTYRKSMDIGEITLDYVYFHSKELQTFLRWWNTKTITETKGQFGKIPLEQVQEILPYTDNVLCSRNTKLKKLNIVYKGFQFDFGTGGIHGAIGSGIWRASSKKKIKLVDVSSYYPNLCAKNGFHPAHFPVEIFVEVINILYQQRMDGKKIDDMQIVKAIKLALNGALYGKSNDKFSCMYDPQMMMTICVNGQLLLVMLAEWFLDNDIEIIQINTDGILVYVDVEKEQLLDELCAKWMNLTNLKLDYDNFDLIAQKDCNNYLARFTNGKIKTKGAAFTHKKLDLHKNHSALVIQQAVEEYIIHGLPPEISIPDIADESNENLFLFFSRAKLSDKKHKLYGRIGEDRHRLQKITRYYVAKQGMSLEKEMPPLKGKTEVRVNAIEKGYLVMPCNDLRNFTPQEVRENINFEYYITKANEIIEQLEN